MEPVFYTEKEIEGYLVTETRLLAWPDGTTKAFTGFRLLWMAFDELVRRCGYTPERLIELAVQETEVAAVPFETAFPGVIAYLDHHLLGRRNA